MPQIFGGGQEFRMRAGTENPALVVGFAKALELSLNTNLEQVEILRDQLLDDLLEIPGVSLNGTRENRLKNNINIQVSGVSGESLVMRLDMEGLAASSGSACSSGKTEASQVLLGMGKTESEALQSLRLTLGKFTTKQEIEQASKILKRVIRELSPS